ncbi:predicted protein [Botrytis cinerea T4]|uniref:Uncharacterized protein n=1 Tax=Botryotinia fuckeliana (strain T4) TaxID=999810 RepID=G2YVU8_BOTF4|nr:predicted protein [Botrytis cinerea T4]
MVELEYNRSGLSPKSVENVGDVKESQITFLRLHHDHGKCPLEGSYSVPRDNKSSNRQSFEQAIWPLEPRREQVLFKI